MLQTGQILLASALVEGVRLDRGAFLRLVYYLRRKIELTLRVNRVAAPEYAAYVSNPDVVPRHAGYPMRHLACTAWALAGKELGTDVGQWFGPSVAAGAIKYVFPSLSLSFSSYIHPSACAVLHTFSLFCVV